MPNQPQSFVFQKPTYLIKAVKPNFTSLRSNFVWPIFGPVDDGEKFNAHVNCGSGLYGYTINQLLAGPTDSSNYLSTKIANKAFLLIEVETLEIIHESKYGQKCKVPRCNVVAAYQSEDWVKLCQHWSELLGGYPTVTEIKLKFQEWAQICILDDSLRADIKSWFANSGYKRPSDECQTDEERAEYHYLKTKLLSDRDVTVSFQELGERISNFINSTHCAGAREAIWALLQRDTTLLFGCHPYIADTMMKLFQEKTVFDYAARNCSHWAYKSLKYFPISDQLEIQELAGIY